VITPSSGLPSHDPAEGKGGKDALITLEERQSLGSSARTGTPRSSHTGWAPAAGRRNPVDLLDGQNANREPDLEEMTPLGRGDTFDRAITD
jgi:hypothetical protein